MDRRCVVTLCKQRMNVNPTIWDKVTRMIVVGIVVAMVAGVFVWYLPVIQQ
ncbi:MAG: hypothetical protein ACI9VS_002003, partial [Candidatus Binatia bacterium]